MNSNISMKLIDGYKITKDDIAGSEMTFIFKRNPSRAISLKNLFDLK